MANKKIFGFVLFLTLPFLMGNSPAPGPFISQYELFSNTSIVALWDVSVGAYEYKTTITNEGSDYINVNETIFEYNFQYNTMYVSPLTFLPPNTAIKPGEVKEVSFYYNDKILNPKLKLFAYNGGIVLEENDYTYVPLLELEGSITYTIYSSSYAEYTYSFQFNYESSYVNKYMITFYSTDMTFSLLMSSPYFSVHEQLDLDSFEIIEVVAFNGRKINSNNFGLGFMIIILFTIIGVAGLAFIGVTVTLVIILFKVLVRKKKETPDNDSFT